MMRSIFQRNSQDFALIPIAGCCAAPVYSRRGKIRRSSQDWHVVAKNPTGGLFEGTLQFGPEAGRRAGGQTLAQEG